MPTLAEIEAGLRARFAQLSEIAADEEAKRVKVRRLITRTAHVAGNNNSIGESLDELLIELGLEPRPLHITVTARVTFREKLANIYVVRDAHVWNSYGNLQSAVVETTSTIGFTHEVPRDHDGCACTFPIPPELVTQHVGTIPDNVELVGVEPIRCGFSEYPHTQGLSITGGHVYRGTKIPALQGFYVYGDYATHRMWACREDRAGGKHEVVTLNKVPLQPSSFAEEPDGEILMTGFAGRNGKVFRLVPAPAK